MSDLSCQNGAYIYMKNPMNVKTIFRFFNITVRNGWLKQKNKCSNFFFAQFICSTCSVYISLLWGRPIIILQCGLRNGADPRSLADVELASQSDMLKRRGII